MPDPSIRALVIGIDAYPPDTGALDGCANDARALAAFLEAAVPAERLALRTLLDGEATPTAVAQAFAEHLGGAGPDEVVLVTYAGHGSQAPVPGAPGEPDGLAETLCLLDADGARADLLDRDLGALLDGAAAGGARVVAILDCCHSGAGTRAVRGAKVRAARRAAAPVAPLGRALVPDAPPRPHVLLAACRSSELAQEVDDDGQPHGALTSALLAALRALGPRAALRDPHARAALEVRLAVADQHPLLEAIGGGDPGLPLLGGAARARPAFPVVRDATDGSWLVLAGAAHGLAGGASATALDVYPALADDAALDDPAQALARVAVEAVEAVSARLADAPALAALPLDAAYVAVVRSPRLRRLRVALEGPAAEVARLATEAAAPAVAPWVEVVDRAPDVVLLSDGTTARFERPDGGPTALPALPAAQAAASLDDLGRWEALRTLANPDGAALAAALQVELFHVVGEPDTSTLAGLEPLVGPLPDTQPPARFMLRVGLAADAPAGVALAVLDLPETGGIFPLGPTDRVEPGESVWLNRGHPMQALLPAEVRARGVTRLVDALVVLATADDLDPTLLAQPDIGSEVRAAGRAPTALAALAARTRHVGTGDGGDAGAGDDGWATRVVELVVEAAAGDAPTRGLDRPPRVLRGLPLPGEPLGDAAGVVVAAGAAVARVPLAAGAAGRDAVVALLVDDEERLLVPVGLAAPGAAELVLDLAAAAPGAAAQVLLRRLPVTAGDAAARERRGPAGGATRAVVGLPGVGAVPALLADALAELAPADAAVVVPGAAPADADVLRALLAEVAAAHPAAAVDVVAHGHAGLVACAAGRLPGRFVLLGCPLADVRLARPADAARGLLAVAVNGLGATAWPRGAVARLVAAALDPAPATPAAAPAGATVLAGDATVDADAARLVERLLAAVGATPAAGPHDLVAGVPAGATVAPCDHLGLWAHPVARAALAAALA